jgi:hypothetical protein
MSIRVYLRGEQQGLNCKREAGRLFFEPSGMRLPDTLSVEDIEEVTYRGTFETPPAREPGVYGDATTTAVVDTEGSLVRINITGKTIEAVWSLYQQIRAGTILPTSSWWAPQISSAQQPTTTE